MAYNYGRLKILVADDSPLMRELLRALLEIVGVGRIRTVETVDQAWSVLFELDPDLIVLDWNMPGDGLTLVNRIRRDPQSPNPFVPILMVTGYRENDRVEQARDAGVNEFLIKPLTANTFYRHIEAIVDDERDFIRAMPYLGPDRRRGERDGFNGPDRRSEARMV